MLNTQTRVVHFVAAPVAQSGAALDNHEEDVATEALPPFAGLQGTSVEGKTYLDGQMIPAIREVGAHAGGDVRDSGDLL